MTEIHTLWQDMRSIGGLKVSRPGFQLKALTKPDDQRKAAVAVLDIMDIVRSIHAVKLHIDEIRRVSNPHESLKHRAMGKCSPIRE